MREKWNELHLFYKGILISLIYSAFALLISLVLLIVDTSWLYGSLTGFLLIFLSYTIVWILYFKIPLKDKASVVMTTLAWAIRILLFMTVFLLMIFVINPQLSGNEIFAQDDLIYPINTISMLLVYVIPATSYMTVPLVDIIVNRKK